MSGSRRALSASSPVTRLHVADEAAVDGRPRLELAVPLEHAAEDEQLGGDLGRREPQALALPGEVGGEPAGSSPSSSAAMKDGSEPSCPSRPSRSSEGTAPRRERLVDALDGQIPCGQPHDPVHAIPE